MPFSHLYVPAADTDRVAKAVERAPGAVILDLEDSVAPDLKPLARELAVETIARHGADRELWVRINAGDEGLRDLEQLSKVAPHGVWLAKAEDVHEIRRVGAALPAALVGLLIESARGILDLRSLALEGGAAIMQVGEIDLAADLGHRGSRGADLEWARHLVVLTSAAGGLSAPVAPVDPDFRDLETFRATTEHLRDIGFGGRACIHPAQARVVEEVFTPSDDDLERAHRTVDEYEAAVAAGRGAATDARGMMIDAATVRDARRLTGR